MLNGLPIFNTEFYAVIIDDVVTSANYNIAVNAENRLKSSEFVFTPNDALYRVTKLDFIVPILPMEIGEGQFEIRDVQLSDEPVKITQMWIVSGADILPIYEVSLYEKKSQALV